MKKIIIPVIALSLSILFTGCWDIMESEKLGLVTVIGIDIANDDQIKLVVQEISEQKQATPGQQGGASVKAPVKLHEGSYNSYRQRPCWNNRGCKRYSCRMRCQHS